MKKVSLAILGGALLATGGCTTMATQDYYTRVQACQSQVSYALAANGDIQIAQPNCSHLRPPASNNEGAIVAAALGVGALLLYAVYKAADNNKASKVEPASNPLIPIGGSSQSSWTTDVIQPVYQPL